MKRLFVFALFVSLLFSTGIADVTSKSTDWSQWHGNDRTNISKETGLMKAWNGTPPVAWSVKSIGAGYGSLAIKDNSILVQGVKDGQSTVFCLSRADGKAVWATALGVALDQDRGGGPRSTPTIDGDRAYALTENGDLACLKLKDGAAVWKKNILKEFKGNNPHWLISESPLVDGNNLIVTPGGDGASIVALDKMTGKTVWTSKELNDGAGYASCLAVNVGGVRAIVGFTDRAGVGVRASDGKLLWRYETPSNRTANCSTPVFADNKVYYTSAYGTGGGLLELKAEGGAVTSKEVYFNKEMQNHHGGVVLVNGYLYGFSNAILMCMEFATGKVMWRNRSVGKGSITYADGYLYLLGEKNTVGLAEATPEAYKETGRFEIDDQGLPSWAHPVVCGGKLYIRNQGMLTCYDVKAK